MTLDLIREKIEEAVNVLGQGSANVIADKYVAFDTIGVQGIAILEDGAIRIKVSTYWDGGAYLRAISPDDVPRCTVDLIRGFLRGVLPEGGTWTSM